uniref:C2H2-type domain-containing protein n=1 Tax=Oryza punctata TaxID=4537 RepID=A0A0E0KC27_ORYPU
MASGKRSRRQAEEAAFSLFDSSDMVRILLLFSGAHGRGGGTAASPPERMFQCKTCNRQFPTFQALGGHRASSHKKRRCLADGDRPPSRRPSPRCTGTCSICGLEFAVGQALGGHMRRHQAVMVDGLGLGLRLGIGVVGQNDDEEGKKMKAAAAAELVFDLNVPALE